MEDHEKATIKIIRDHGGRLDGKSDHALAELYREWSQETASAGWLTPSERGIAAFYDWATIAPCDRPQQNGP